MTGSNRDLTTTRTQVFGDVACGTTCRVCGRDVDDGRSKTCSEYCNNLLSAVMGMLNWNAVRRRIIERDDETCQECGFDYRQERRARDHLRALIQERAGDRLESPGVLEIDDEAFDWDAHFEAMDEWRERRKELRERYGDPNDRSRRLEVDHITPVSEGGHPFDPGNLQTLCVDCHQEKTAQENSERAERQTPSRGDMSESLFAYVAGGDADGA